MTCLICRADCPESAKFCPQCGALLPIPPAPEQPLSPEPPEMPLPEPAESPAPESPQVFDTVEAPEVTDVADVPEISDVVDAPEAPEAAQPSTPDTPQPAESPEEVPVQFPDWQEPPAPPQPPRPVKRGTHWIPILIMVILCAVGLTLYFALPYETASPSYSADAGTSETPWFENDNGTLYFYEFLYSGPQELTVPDTVDGMPVTALAPWCFAESDRITTVILPDTLESIGAGAFYGCTAMRGIYLPEGLTGIGADAFHGCSALEAICIPSTVETIEAGAFDGCFSLAYILYNGIHSHWLDLYQDHISMETQVYCTDGTFIHRQRIP